MTFGICLPRVITEEMKMVSCWIYKVLHGVNEDALCHEFHPVRYS
jgi:hypothetical protein